MRRKKKLYVALGIVQVFIALGAIPAGMLFLVDPTGSFMGMNAEMLRNAPFHDFSVPGLFLLIVLGVGNAVAALFSFLLLNLSGKAGIVLGLILVVWIAVQVYWMGFTSFLQPVMGVTGVVEMVLGYKIRNNLKSI